MLSVSVRSRVVAIDVLRGFALFGIFVVNLPFLAHPIVLSLMPAPQGGVDQAAAFVDAFLFQGKFFLLFSFLFGSGFAVMLAQRREGETVAASMFGVGFAMRLSQDVTDDAIRPQFRRRLIGLFLLGILDATLLFVGDILVSYAVLGVLLWPLRHWEPRRLLKLAIGMLFVASVCHVGIAFLDDTGDPNQVAHIAQMADDATRNYLGTFAQATMQRLHDLVIFYLFTPLFNYPSIVAMFALGLAAGKADVFRNLDKWLPRLRLIVRVALPVGILGNLGFATLPQTIWAVPILAFFPWASCALAFCYAVAVLSLAHGGRLGWLAPAGRMSLSNYLGQAVVANILFCGWGFGLFGTMGGAALFGIAVGVFAAQVVLSNLWLRYFRFGLDEWLLRSFIGKEWLPLRVENKEAQA